MASAHIYTVNTSADVSLVATTLKTLLQVVTPATRRIWIKEIQISFKSVTATDVPVLVQLVKQTTAGTASAATITPDVDDHPAALTSAQEIFTVEPTTTTIKRSWEITPIGGLLVYQLPLGDELEMPVSTRVALVATAPQNQSCRAYIKYNE